MDFQAAWVKVKVKVTVAFFRKKKNNNNNKQILLWL